MIKLYSYVVDHDDGFAPNPFHEYCTLVHCMFSKSNRRNLIEMVKEDYDSGYEVWVIGTGGSSPFTSGHGTIVYLMKVNDAVPIWDYYSDEKFKNKNYNKKGNGVEKLGDRKFPIHLNIEKRYALISKEYFYFGKRAIKIDNPDIDSCLEKRGPRYRKDFNESYIIMFLDAAKEIIKREFGKNSYGMYGLPCTMRDENNKFIKLCKQC